jgi:hypothetical protein
MPEKKKFQNAIPVCILRNNFKNGVQVPSITKIPLGVTKQNVESRCMGLFSQTE